MFVGAKASLEVALLCQAQPGVFCSRALDRWIGHAQGQAPNRRVKMPMSRVTRLGLLLLAATAMGCQSSSLEVPGAGGATGSGGFSGSGGSSQGMCSTTCTVDQNCVNGACISRVGGTCSAPLDCPSNATCCDGANQTCDGTRLPTGDGTNPGQLVVSADGLTVTDTITGLVWQRDGSGPRAGCTNATTCTLAEAEAYCAALVLGGVSGWRVPARMELLTIVDFTRRNPSIDRTAFPDTPAEWFWHSTPCPTVGGYRCYVNFNYGYSFDTDVGSYLRVRCVR
jgi:hypothetical protein